jgi:hypothetical protein
MLIDERECGVYLYDSSGREVAHCFDCNSDTTSRFTCTLNKGKYYLGIKHITRGLYQIKTSINLFKIEVKPKNVTLNKRRIKAGMGEIIRLVATIFPSNATIKTLTWESSNPSVATVKNGKVKCKKSGTTQIGCAEITIFASLSS